MTETGDDESILNQIVELRNRCVAGVPAPGGKKAKPHRLLDAGMVRLADALADNDTVTFLKIPHAKIQRDAFDALMSALGSCSAMINFCLKANVSAKMDGAALSLAKALKTNATLTSLYINSSIGDKHVDALAEVLANKRDVLVNLQLPGNNFSSSSLVMIVQAMAPNQAQRVADGPVCNTEASYPSPQPRQTPDTCSLRILDLSVNRIDDAVAHAVAKAVACPHSLPHIQRIDLKHNNIKTSGVKALCQVLQTMPSVVVDIQFGIASAGSVDHPLPNLLREIKTTGNSCDIDLFGNTYHELVAEGRAILKAQAEQMSTPVIQEATANVVESVAKSKTKAGKRAIDKSNRRLAQIKRKLKILWNPALLTCAIEKLAEHAGATCRQTTIAFKPRHALSLAMQTLQVAEELAPALSQLYGFQPGMFGHYEMGSALSPLEFAEHCLSLNQQWRKYSSPQSPPMGGNAGSGCPVGSDVAMMLPKEPTTAPLAAVSAQSAVSARPAKDTGGSDSADVVDSDLILLNACTRLVQRLITTGTKPLQRTALAEQALCAVGAIAGTSSVLLEKHDGAGMPVESWQRCFALCSLMALRLSTFYQHDKNFAETADATPAAMNTSADSSRIIDSPAAADASSGTRVRMSSGGSSSSPMHVSTFYHDVVLVIDNLRRVVNEATASKEAFGAQLNQDWRSCASLELEFADLARQLKAPSSEFDRQRSALAALSSTMQRKYPLGEFLVYGSAASGFGSVGSDLDVTFFPFGRIALKVRAALSLSRDSAVDSLTTPTSGVASDKNSGTPVKAKYPIKVDDTSKADDDRNLDKTEGVACVIDSIAQTLDAHSDYSDVEAVHRARVPVVSCKHYPSVVDLDISVRNHFPV